MHDSSVPPSSGDTTTAATVIELSAGLFDHGRVLHQVKKTFMCIRGKDAYGLWTGVVHAPLS